MCDLGSVANDFRVRKISSTIDCVAKNVVTLNMTDHQCNEFMVVLILCCALSQRKPLENSFFIEFFLMLV